MTNENKESIATKLAMERRLQTNAISAQTHKQTVNVDMDTRRILNFRHRLFVFLHLAASIEHLCSKK